MGRNHTSISEGLVILEERRVNTQQNLTGCKAKLESLTRYKQDLSYATYEKLVEIAKEYGVNSDLKMKTEYNHQYIDGYSTKMLYEYIVGNNLETRDDVTIEIDYDRELYFSVRTSRLETKNEFCERVSTEIKEKVKWEIEKLVRTITDLERSIKKLSDRIEKQKLLLTDIYQKSMEAVK